MYYEYWDLKKPPFDNVPDPSMYVDSHESVENTIAETLFAIEEGNECVAVVVGDVGLGKTLSLRIILDSLDHEKYRIAFITNPDMSFIQLLRETLGQLTGIQCEIRGKIGLLEAFNRLLFETVDQGRKVLIFIDEANALTPANLESLRLLTNMQDDQRNLLTIVLAGQVELAKRLEHPKRANLFQRIGTYCKLDKIGSEPLTRNYIETRLRLAGSDRSVFTDDAIHAIWEYSEYGVPRLVNKICKLCLKAGETNGFSQINGEVVKQVGDRFQRLSGPAIQKRRPRRRPEIVQESRLPEGGEVEMIPTGEKGAEGRCNEKHEMPAGAVEYDLTEASADPAGVESKQIETESASPKTDEMEGIYINGVRIPVAIAPHILEEVMVAPQEYRDRIAGVLAAQTLERHNNLVSSVSKDPVAIWGQIRDFILLQFGQQKKAS
jgi:type II secretory pathway predicted ATPase ExeA